VVAAATPAHADDPPIVISTTFTVTPQVINPSTPDSAISFTLTAHAMSPLDETVIDDDAWPTATSGGPASVLVRFWGGDSRLPLDGAGSLPFPSCAFFEEFAYHPGPGDRTPGAYDLPGVFENWDAIRSCPGFYSFAVDWVSSVPPTTPVTPVTYQTVFAITAELPEVETVTGGPVEVGDGLSAIITVSGVPDEQVTYTGDVPGFPVDHDLNVSVYEIAPSDLALVSSDTREVPSTATLFTANTHSFENGSISIGTGGRAEADTCYVWHTTFGGDSFIAPYASDFGDPQTWQCPEPPPVDVTGVSVAPTSFNLTVGSTRSLAATVSPSDATNQAVTWSSSNGTVASVDSTGVVTAKTAGTATITVSTSDGEYTATSTVTVTAVQTEVAPKTVQFVVSPSLAGNRYGDVLSIDSAGTLWRAPGSASGKLGNKIKLGSGWAGKTLYAPGDWNRDGKNDLLAVDTGGRMFLYPGTGKGSVGNAIQIGHGWAQLNTIPTGDLTGDGINDLLAIDKTGKLYLYSGNGKGGFKPGKRQVGHGWTGMQLLHAGDLNRDGKTDILGVKADGKLLFYAGKGNGGFQPARQIGHGWTGLALTAGADLNGDGITDIVSQTKTGAVTLYKGTGRGGFQSPVKIG